MRDPKFTRLRWVSSNNPDKLVRYLETLSYRVQLYEIVWNGKEYVMFFVPDDKANFVLGSGKLK